MNFTQKRAELIEEAKKRKEELLKELEDIEKFLELEGVVDSAPEQKEEKEEFSLEGLDPELVQSTLEAIFNAPIKELKDEKQRIKDATNTDVMNFIDEIKKSDLKLADKARKIDESFNGILSEEEIEVIMNEI